MARKTAMKKDPTVSIAIPQYEKDRLRTLKPGKPDAPGVSDGVVQGKPGPLKRVSPGVYRSPSGQLVGSRGQALPGQPSMRDRASDAARQGAGGRGMGDGRDRAQQGVLLDAMNQSQQPGQIATRPPAPLGTMPGDAATQAGGLAQNGQQFGTMPQYRPNFTPEQLQQMFGNNPFFANPGMQMPNMPQPSANNGGQYRLSPGVYGTREQAMEQFNMQMQQPMQQQMPMPYNPFFKQQG